VVAFALGYQARTYFSTAPTSAKSSSSAKGTIDLTDKPQLQSKKGKAPLPTADSGSGSDSESDSELDTDSEAEDLALALSSNPQSLKPTSFDEVKLVLIVNESLKMLLKLDMRLWGVL
jgi:hypothetical protein